MEGASWEEFLCFLPPRSQDHHVEQMFYLCQGREAAPQP